MVIPVVKEVFLPGFAVGRNPVNLCVSTTPGLCLLPWRIGGATLPNHPCYQLHHTRILNFPVLLSVGIYVVKGEFEAKSCAGGFQNKLLSQRLLGLHLKVVGCRTHPPKSSAIPPSLHPEIFNHYKRKQR